MRAGLEELAQRIFLLTRRFQEGVEIIMDRLDHLIEMLAIGGLSFLVLGAGTRKMRRDIGILDLVFGARDDAYPGLPVLLGVALDGREQNDVVDADDIGLHLVENARQILLGPLGRLDNHRPAVLHVVADLVIGALAEIRDVAVDEVDPESRHLLGRQRCRQVHRMGLEAITLVDVDKARVREEHHLVAKFPQRLADTHRIERRAEGGFRKKGDDLLRLLLHHRFLRCRFCHCCLPECSDV